MNKKNLIIGLVSLFIITSSGSYVAYSKVQGTISENKNREEDLIIAKKKLEAKIEEHERQEAIEEIDELAKVEESVLSEYQDNIEDSSVEVSANEEVGVDVAYLEEQEKEDEKRRKEEKEEEEELEKLEKEKKAQEKKESKEKKRAEDERQAEEKRQAEEVRLREERAGSALSELAVMESKAKSEIEKINSAIIDKQEEIQRIYDSPISMSKMNGKIALPEAELESLQSQSSALSSLVNQINATEYNLKNYAKYGTLPSSSDIRLLSSLGIDF
ncbi:hypothetical protein ACFL08_02885 [Patescibacteria group bacterium]